MIQLRIIKGRSQCGATLVLSWQFEVGQCRTKSCSYFLASEEREMHFAVDALLGELWQVAEVVGAGVLHNDEGSGLHHLAVEDELGNLWQLRQVVGWVGEDEVKLARARANKLENVALHLDEILLLQLLLDFANEVVLCRGFLHACHAGATTRQELEADGSCSREEVEGGQAFEVHAVVEHIEQVLARHIGSGACCDVPGHVEASSAIFPADYSHVLVIRDQG